MIQDYYKIQGGDCPHEIEIKIVSNFWFGEKSTILKENVKITIGWTSP